MPPQAQHIINLKQEAIRLYRASLLREAGTLFQKVCQLDPDDADAWYSLSYICLELRNNRGAELSARKTIALKPDFAPAYTVLGVALHSEHRYADSIHASEKAIQLKKNNPATYNNLGNSYLEMGNPATAINCYRRAEQLEPKPKYHSNLLMALNYSAQAIPEEVFREHRRWGCLHGTPNDKKKTYTNSSSLQRSLRIGYISPDLFTHSVAFFFEPLLAAHDRDTCQITCYSGVASTDETTDRLRSLADRWRNIFNTSDHQVIQNIITDRIDILVDLAGHTAGNRLGVFAQKPAPVQITYLGYPNTTGVPGIDYRLTDSWADPPGATDNLHTEKLIRLPHGFLCYQAPTDAPDVDSSPFERNGYITFGSFNNLSKMTPEVIAAWTAILRNTSDTKLLLKTRSFTEPSTRLHYLKLFSEKGIDQARVELRGPTHTIREHLEAYADIDIALDTFPYNGTTTTCEALWMGVPVITLAGKVHAGRVGISLLSQVGHKEWIADDINEYVSLAQRLTQILLDKKHSRVQLRTDMANSPLCDRQSFTLDVETMYRVLWERWCKSANKH